MSTQTDVQRLTSDEMLRNDLFISLLHRENSKKSFYQRLASILHLRNNVDQALIKKVAWYKLKSNECFLLSLLVAPISQKLANRINLIGFVKKTWSMRYFFNRVAIKNHYRDRCNVVEILLSRVYATFYNKRKLDYSLLSYNQQLLKRDSCYQRDGYKKLISQSITEMNIGGSNVNSTENSPLISIIVPAWNVEKYIIGCIESLQSQTWKNIEIIVVDDNSSDETYIKLIHKFQNDSRIKVLRQPIQKGPYAAKNIGLAVAKGKYCTFLDGDDVAEPNRLTIHMSQMLKRPHSVASTSKWIKHNEDGYITTRKVWPLIRLNVGSLFFERELVLKQVGYFHEVKHSADGEFIKRIIQAFGRHRLVEIDLPLTFGAQREESLTGSAGYGYYKTLVNKDRIRYKEQWFYWQSARKLRGEKVYLGKGQKMEVNVPVGMVVK